MALLLGRKCGPRILGRAVTSFAKVSPRCACIFIVSGLVRLYHNRDGRELVHGFDYENRWTAAYESVLTGEPAPTKSFSANAFAEWIRTDMFGRGTRPSGNGHYLLMRA